MTTVSIHELETMMGDHWNWLPPSYWQAYLAFINQPGDRVCLKALSANVVASHVRQSEQDTENSLKELKDRKGIGLWNYLKGLLNLEEGRIDDAKTFFESASKTGVDLKIRALIDGLAGSSDSHQDQTLNSCWQTPVSSALASDKGSCSSTGSEIMGCSRKLNSSPTKIGQTFSRLRNTDEVMSFPAQFLDSVEIKIINLEHRDDRWAHITSHLENFGFLNASQYRFDAIGVQEFGELGCTRSHLLAMTEYLCKSEKPFLMILEDDFRFKQSPAEVAKVMSWFVNEKPGDVLMLNCSCAMTSPTEIRIGTKQVTRVLSSNSMAGFLVERSHVSKIISVLLDSLASHENMRDIYLSLKAEGRREVFRPILNMICNDRVWIKLQTSCRYLTVSPSIGSTIESYSDIESRHVSYSNLENQ